jgi:hypothetical protein
MRTLIDVQGNPAMSWLLQQQMGPLGVDADLSLSRDPAARTLSVDVLHIDFPGQNDIRLTGMIGDLDLDAVAANPETVLTANLRNLDLTVVTEGLFETVVLMPLGTIVLDGSTDPEGDVDRLKRLATGIIDRLPDTLTDMPSRAAMTALVMDMPHPWGTVSLQVNADPGLGAVRMVGPALNGPPETLDGWLALLNGVRVTFGYQPHAQDDAE